MGNFPAITATDFVRILKQLGFELHRQKGSHAVYKHSNGRRVVVLMHTGATLKPGTFAGLLKDIGLERNEFLRLLQGKP